MNNLLEKNTSKKYFTGSKWMTNEGYQVEVLGRLKKHMREGTLTKNKKWRFEEIK